MEQFVTSTEKIKDGEYILKEGTEGTLAFYAYVLQAGKARVEKNVHGKQVPIGMLKKGDIFGEMTFLGGGKRTASVIADGNVEVGMVPRDTFMEAIAQLPQDTRAKLEAMVSDLTCFTETCGHLLTRVQDLQNIKSRLIDMKSFEREIQNMPEILREVVIALAHRLNLAIENCNQLAALIEEVVKPVASISVTLAKKSGLSAVHAS